jgi:Uri superfamily endonuclease
MNGLGARLRRHCSQKRKIHWHIDHLLTAPDARIKKIILYPAAPGQECRQNKRIAACAGAAVILKNFGASDCTSGCASHLLFFAKDCLPEFSGVMSFTLSPSRKEQRFVPDLGAPLPLSPF